MTNFEHQGQLVAQYRKIKRWTQQDLAEALRVDLRTVQRMEKQPVIKHIRRRESLVGLLGIPADKMGLEATQQRETAHLLINDDPMAFLEQGMLARWKIYQLGGSLCITHSLDIWMREVTKFVQAVQRTVWHKRALSVLAMSYQLQGNIMRDLMDFTSAHRAYRKALSIARELEDSELIALTLLREGFIFFHQEKPLKTIPYLQGALQAINNRGSLHLRKQILGALSEAYAKAHLPQECWRSMGTAEHLAEHITQHQEDVLNQRLFSFIASPTTFIAVPITAQKGINAVLLNDYARALALINKSLATYDPTLIRGRANLLVQKAEAHYGLREIDACVFTAEEALLLSRSVGSTKTIMQLRRLYTALEQSPWHKERIILQLGAILSIDSDSFPKPSNKNEYEEG